MRYVCRHYDDLARRYVYGFVSDGYLSGAIDDLYNGVIRCGVFTESLARIEGKQGYRAGGFIDYGLADD